MPNSLITIIGPTAIGKTSLSIDIANHFGCDILSCDSRQFYKELLIGTAPPSPDEQAQAKHYFIHDRSIFDDYTVGDYENDAISLLDELYQENDKAILIGGSGLYVDAVLKGFDEFPEIDSQIRIQLQQELEEKGLEFLQDKLKELDVEYSKIVDIQNPQRVIRALEVCIGTGKTFTEFRVRKVKERNFVPIKIGLNIDRDKLYERINLRVDLMMEAGLLAEAKKMYPHKEINSLQTVGYRELFRYFDGEFTLEFAVSEIKKNTRRFAKRQLTWFRKDKDIKWFDPKEKDEILKYISTQLK
ncbi:MAG: tRNA (adenosine(37)-N6)-dimethylallyltransferase MiaA [Flavobacteriales bacterium]|nr:tRNA (adenosine(37)-N6)-dimethylallyltransferase MiaA [Flavobacteriales bacterium]